MSELVTARISPNKFLRNSKKGRRSKNKFQIELGKTVSPSKNISLNNFKSNEKSNSIKITNSQKVKPVLKQDIIDKYFRRNLKEKLDKQKHKKYYKSPKKNSNYSPNKPVINNIPKKKKHNPKFNKITIKVNKNYYLNLEDRLFNPNAIKSKYDNFDNMSPEDIYLCNALSQKVRINN